MILDIPPKLPDNPTRFMDRLRALIRSRNMAYKTEQTYCHWIKRFIRFHGMQHPSACSAKEVEQFLSHLAVQRNSSISTQRTALNALVFALRLRVKDVDFRMQQFIVRSPVDEGF